MKNIKFFTSWWVVCSGLFLVLLVGFFIRFFHLNSLPVFADEAIYIRWAQVMRAEPTLRFLPLSDGKQPLFMWVVIPFFKLFSDPLLAGRFVSVLTGIGTIFGVFTASYILFGNKKISLLASLIYAVSPFSVFFDRMALTDSMLAMFGIWIFAFSAISIKYLRFDLAMVTGFVLGGALLTKSPSLFFSLLIPATVLLLTRVGKIHKKFKINLRAFVIFVPTYIIGYGMYNILRLGPNFHLLKLRNADYVYPLNHLFQNPFDPLLAHLRGIFDYFVKLGPWPLIALFVIGLVVGYKKYKKQTILLILWGLVPIIINSEFAKVMTARYILFSLSFLYIIAAISIESLTLLRKVTLLSIFLFVILSLNFHRLLFSNVKAISLPRTERSGYLEEWTSGYGIREAAEYVKGVNQKDPNLPIVVGTEGFFGTLPDGLSIYLNQIPNITVIGVGLGFDKVPESLVNSRKAGNTTFLLINSSRLNLVREEKNSLELIASYPKAERLVGSREYNLYGPSDSLLFFRLK